jgi:hypothetical protein
MSVNAQDLVYKPRNPAFGDTFNYQWLASSAESQNKFKEPSSAKAQKTDLENCGPIEFSIVKSNFKIIIHAAIWFKDYRQELYFG